MRRGVIALLAVILAACAAPNLDKSVAGESATSVRERIVDHGDWKKTLSEEQLDQLAAFIAEYAGAADGVRAQGAPGLAVWQANDCGACHALAAAEPAD
jgi:hypothetical protein